MTAHVKIHFGQPFSWQLGPERTERPIWGGFVQVVRRLAIVAGWLSGLYTILLAVVSTDICSTDVAYSDYCTALRAM